VPTQDKALISYSGGKAIYPSLYARRVVEALAELNLVVSDRASASTADELIRILHAKIVAIGGRAAIMTAGVSDPVAKATLAELQNGFLPKLDKAVEAARARSIDTMRQNLHRIFSMTAEGALADVAPGPKASLLARALHRLGLHQWEEVFGTGAHSYRECALCGRRDVTNIGGGYQPVDRDWLAAPSASSLLLALAQAGTKRANGA